MHRFASDTRQSLLWVFFFFIFSFSFPLPCFYWINFTHLRWWCWNWMSEAALLRLPPAENPICIDVCVSALQVLLQTKRLCEILCASFLFRWLQLTAALILCPRIQALSSQQSLRWELLLMKSQHYWPVSDKLLHELKTFHITLSVI